MTDIQNVMIEKLQMAGLNGVRRKWSMGDTVIAFRRYITHDDGINEFDGYICIYPKDGGWSHCVGTVNGDDFCSADAAVDMAIKLLKLSNEELSKICNVYYKRITNKL